MGKWHEVAVVSTCPHYMQRKRGNPVTVVLQLKHVASQSNFTVAATTLRSNSYARGCPFSRWACYAQHYIWCVRVPAYRNGSCTETSTHYSLTDTPGRFFYHFASRLFSPHIPAYTAHPFSSEASVRLHFLFCRVPSRCWCLCASHQLQWLCCHSSAEHRAAIGK